MKHAVIAVFTALALGACAQGAVSPSASGKPASVKSAEISVGEIIAIEDESDGSVVELRNAATQETLFAVISPANLGHDTAFEYNALKVGTVLKVTGEPFELGERTQMAAKTAISYETVTFAFDTRSASPTEHAACVRAGGVVRAEGRGQFEMCVQDFADAGDACMDASQCFGQCRVDGDTKDLHVGEAIIGKCAPTNVDFGCNALVSNGVYEGTLCVD